MQLPLFPLNTVLFPGGLLPLKIFEQRYMDMAKQCLRDESAFGVCAILEGREVGAPAVPARVGCSARIIEWDMPQLGVLQVLAQGEQRFHVNDYHDNGAGLLIGAVERIDHEPVTAISEEFLSLTKYGQAFSDHTTDRFKPNPQQLADAVWLSYRLSELLPLPLALKQELLELTDPNTRLGVLLELLQRAEAGGEN
jgi:Lon protease-like protein